MTKIFTLFDTRVTVAVVVVIAGLLWYGLVYNTPTASPSEQSSITTADPTVSILTSREYQSGNSLSLLGTVAAASEAAVQSERGGQVISVRTSLGDTVRAGSVLLTFENASERAALTQAEGAYEAAQASANQGVRRNDSSVRNAQLAIDDAQNRIVETIQSSYSTANNTFVSTLDQFYSNPQGSFPGVRISRTDTTYMRTERIAWQDILATWRNEAEITTYNSQSLTTLQAAGERIERLILLLDHIIFATNNAGRQAVLAGRPVTEYTPALIAERERLVATAQTIRSRVNALAQAEESLQQAQTQDTSGSANLSDAQVKQALGSLQAAQATLAKTIVRSPITGVVNQLTVSVGEFIAPGTVIAEVVNDGALEITTFVSERDFSVLKVGDEVLINGSVPGIVTNLASTLSAATGKREVRIAVSEGELRVGDSVRITRPTNDTTTPDPDTITLPLSAVRFDGSQGYVFEVTEGALVRTDVTISRVTGTNVQITDGITLDTAVVVDARGKQAGQTVIIQN